MKRRILLRRWQCLALLWLVSCGGGDSAERIESARAHLKADNPELAAAELGKLAEELGDQDPELAFNRAIAALAQEQPEVAKRFFGVALERGAKPLRARALLGLATIDLAQLEREAPVAGTLDKAEARAAIVARAEAAILRLSAAHDLDHSQATITERQDRLVAWLRATEDTWARRDAAAASEKRRALGGAAFFASFQEELGKIATEAASGDSWSTLALKVRGLASDLEVASNKLEELKDLEESTKASATEGVDRLRARLEQLSAAFKDAALSELPTALLLSQDAAGRMVVLTGELPAAARALLAQIERVSQGLADQEPPLPDAVPKELAAGARMSLTALETLLRRPSMMATLPAAVIEMGESARSDADARIGEAEAQLVSGARAPAEAALQLARERFAAWVAEIDWAQKAAAVLANDLSLEAQDWARQVGESDGTRLPERISAWCTDQSRRLGYLLPALQREQAQAQEGEGNPTVSASEENPRAPLVRLAEDAHAQAAQSVGAGVLAPAVEEQLDNEVRALSMLAVSLQDLLVAAEAAAQDATKIVARNHTARRQERNATETSAEAEGKIEPGMSIRRQAREAEQLVQRTPLLVARAQAELGPPPPAEGETAPAVAPAPPELLVQVEKDWKSGQAALEAAVRDLQVPNDADPAVKEEALRRALGDQALAEKHYQEALRRLKEAQMPLLAAATAVMDADGKALAPLRALVAGRLPAEQHTPLRQTLARATRPALRALPGALEREFATANQAPPGAGTAPPEKDEEREKLLRELVKSLQTADAGFAASRAAAKPAATLTAVSARYLAARNLWKALVDRQGMLKRAIEEETTFEAAVGEYAKNREASPPDAVQGVGSDQAGTKDLVPDLLRLYTAPPPASPGGAEPPKEDPLAKKAAELLPRAEAAMQGVTDRLADREFPAALTRATEAKNLLKELEQEEQNQKPKPEPSPSPSEPENRPEDQERQRRSVQERSDKLKDRLQKQRPPTPVAEDW